MQIKTIRESIERFVLRYENFEQHFLLISPVSIFGDEKSFVDETCMHKDIKVTVP